MSEYGLRLIEKQKLCRNYGVTGRQVRRLRVEARAADGPTGERLLELRLDDVVFRAGFVRTIPAARQLVNHGHITVDGRKVARSSDSVAPDQIIALRERSRELPPVLAPKSFETSWLEVNAAERSARWSNAPEAASMPFPITVQLVVELHSQRL